MIDLIRWLDLSDFKGGPITDSSGDVSAKLRNKEWMLIKNVLFWHNLLKDNTKDHLTFPQIDYQPLTADQLMLVCCL